MKIIKIFKLLVAISCVCLAVSCSDADKKGESIEIQPIVPEGTLFLVNESPVTDAQLGYAVNRFFGDQFVDQRAVKQIEQSLIASRALSQKAVNELDAEVLQDVELAVAAYREERLIAKYIESTTTPEHVSSSEVKAYYDANLEAFGAKTVRELEVIEVDRTASNQSLSVVTAELQAISEETNWENATLPEASKKYQVRTSAQISPRMISAANNLNVDETSGIIVEEDKVYLLRVIDVADIPAKPIEAVSVEIRQRLAAAKLKQYIKKLTDQVLEESVVVSKDQITGE